MNNVLKGAHGYPYNLTPAHSRSWVISGWGREEWAYSGLGMWPSSVCTGLGCVLFPQCLAQARRTVGIQRMCVPSVPTPGEMNGDFVCKQHTFYVSWRKEMHGSGQYEEGVASCGTQALKPTRVSPHISLYPSRRKRSPGSLMDGTQKGHLTFQRETNLSALWTRQLMRLFKKPTTFFFV